MGMKIEIEELKKIYKECDTLVVCSTQNQVVNYIPIVNMIKEREETEKRDERVKLLNITYKTKKGHKFSNSTWDENLRESLNEFIKKNNKKAYMKSGKFLFDIVVPRIYDEDDYSHAIEVSITDMKSNNIIWNITGGQRNILLTVLKLIKNKLNDKKHTIIYMEGNTNRLIVGQIEAKDCLYKEKEKCICKEKNDYIYRELNGTYGCEELDIKLVLGLAGFKVTNKKKRTKKEIEDEIKEEQAIKFLWEYFSKQDKGGEKRWVTFRQKLLEAQSKKSESNEENDKKENGENFNEAFNYLKQEIGEGQYKEDDIKILKNIKGNNSYKLGYWLEAMLVYCLKNAIKNLEEEEERFKGYFTEIRHSVVLNEQYEVNEKNEDGKFCEFDVVLLTKTGQIVIFECKTGLVKSEVTKSRMYTAYAAGGVYGMPILIPPYLSYDNKRAVQQGEEGVWKKMKDTRNAALRSQMPVWHLDEIKEKLKDLFDEVAL